MNIAIPFSFIKERCLLSWNDALWGYDHQYIESKTIIDLASHRIAMGSENLFEIELFYLDRVERPFISEILRKLQQSGGTELEIEIERKWLFLILAWTFENQKSISDPLGAVEEIYADFDYPIEIEMFVRYMPAGVGYNPLLYTKEECEQRLYSKWKEYIDTEHFKYISVSR